MNSFMDEVNFEFDRDRGTVVTLRKRITAADSDEDKEEES